MLKFIDLFSGIGGFRLALESLGLECVFSSEIDKFARQTYKANFETEPSGDITKISSDEIPNHDILTAGFPCFPKGTLITTDKGLKDISEINITDKVLTHTKTYKPVLNVMSKQKQGIYNLKIKGQPSFKVTEEHPFYAIERVRVWNNSLRKYKYIISEPKWIDTKDLTSNHFVAMGIYKNTNNNLNLTKEQCWLIGRYIADGFIRNNKRQDRINSYNNQIIFGIGKHKLEYFKQQIESYYVGYVEERTSIKCKIINKELMNLCLQCGKGAKNKVIPSFIMELPLDLLEVFLDGYLSGDGGIHKNTIKAVSISEKLIYQLGQIINKLYQKHYSILKVETPETTVIEGRIVNQNDYWTISYRKNLQHEYFIKKDGFIWSRVSTKEYDNNFMDTVYNFEVETDNSYIANNIVVHNCQAFSIAGKRRGFDDTRGTLFFEVARIIKDKQPKAFILENVPGLVSHDSGKTFQTIIDTLATTINGQKSFLETDNLGYHVYYGYLNSKDFGVAQNRKRIFIVGFKEPINFRLPGATNSTVKLKDILESEVDEKYYLSEKAIKGLLNHTEKQKEKGNSFQAQFFTRENILATIKANYYKSGQDCLIKETAKNSQGMRINKADNVSVTLSALGGGCGAKTGLYAIPNGDSFRVRRLTPRECARLQGFPESYNIVCSDSQAYKQFGNSVTVNVIQAIAKNVLASLNSYSC